MPIKKTRDSIRTILERIRAANSPIAVYIDKNGQLLSGFYTLGFINLANAGAITVVGVFSPGTCVESAKEIILASARRYGA